MNDVVVPAEPERDPATPPAWSRDSADTGDGERTALPDTIDPRLLFVGFIDPYFDTPLDDEAVVHHRDMAWMSSTSPTTGLATHVQSLKADLQLYFEAEKELCRSSVQTFFTHANFNRLMAVFFRRQQLLARMIHMPTFDPGQADLGLLLAIALCGAGYSSKSVETPALPSRTLQRVAEKYVFQRLKRCPVRDERGEISRCRTLQACQAAYIITFIQLGENDGEIRRRIITKRQPALLNAVRRLGLICDKPSPPSADWREFVYKESCVRLVSWVFFTEGLLALFCNSPPLATVSEMCDQLPCRDELWDADSAARFTEELGKEPAPPGLSMKDLMAFLLSDDWQGEAATACHGLTVFHLYAVIGGTSITAKQSPVLNVNLCSLGSVPAGAVQLPRQHVAKELQRRLAEGLEQVGELMVRGDRAARPRPERLDRRLKVLS
jgi:hypothetical protein